MSRFSAYMRGQTGAQGPQGTPSIIDGVVSTTSQLPAQANEGSAYLVGTDAPKNLYIYINNEWVNQGSILGAGFGEPTGSIEIIPVDSYEKKTGSIVQFEKTQENKAEISELNIDINPVQDLHGYANPWPAGGGKNLCHFMSNHYITVDGEKGSSLKNGLSYPVKVPNGQTVVYSGKQNYHGRGFAVFTDEALTPSNMIERKSSTGFPMTYTATQDCYFVGWLNYDNTATITQDIFNTCELQIEIGSSATSFAPYSNICPISGHTQADIMRDGVNLLPITATGSASSASCTISTNADGSVTINGTSTSTPVAWLSKSGYFKDGTVNDTFYFAPGEYYLQAGSSSPTFWVNLYNVDTNSWVNIGVGKRTLGGNYKIRVSGTNGVNYDNLTIYPMIVLNSDANASFEKYKGISLTIPFGQTVYGAQYDVLTGEMRVTHAYIADLSTGNWQLATIGDVPYFTSNIIATNVKKPSINSEEIPLVCSALQSASAYKIYTGTVHAGIAIETSGNIRAVDGVSTTKEQITAALSGVQLVYPLATPLTLTLTAQQMSTLLGQNTVWASTGDVDLTIKTQNKPSIEITADENSPDSAKVFNFDFKLPPGPEGKAGYGAYKEIQFTTTDSEEYSWDSNILQIDRTELKLIPVYIKNSENQIIDCDFTITENSSQNPNKILCSLTTKISGTLYCIAPINRGTINIGEISTTTGDTASIWNTGTENDAILNFELPRGEKGETALTAHIGEVSTTDSTTASVSIDGNQDLYFNFTIPRGNGIQKIEKIDTSGLTDTYEITYSNGTTTNYTVTNGRSITHSWNGTFLTINSASGQSTENLQGPPGPQGPPGEDGPAGPQGPTALTAEIGSVTTTTGNPLVTISTDESLSTNLIFNFELPQGIQGISGSTGQAAGFALEQVANVQTLASDQAAYVTILADQNSPDTAKIFNFGFGIPRGVQGPQGPQGISGVQNPIIVMTEDDYENIIPINIDPNTWYLIKDY